jgi:hypothetical protein
MKLTAWTLKMCYFDVYRFTHSRIRPFFSGCAMRIEDTLTQLISGQVSLENIPFITVIENDGHYFSLNNRRLYVFKTLRERNLLPNNEITVRVKQPLEREKEKYIPDHCSLTAVIMAERPTKESAPTDEGAPETSLTNTNLVVADNKPTPTKSIVCPIPKEVLREIPNLTKLVETGKLKKANDILQRWVQSKTIDSSQVVSIKQEIGL